MKKLILAATVMALAGASLQTAKAGDREWAVAGKVLTGVAVGAVIASAIDAHADCAVSYSYRAPAYCPPRTVVYAPAPARVVYVPAPVVVYREPVVCSPRAYVSVGYGYGYRHGHHYGWGNDRCR